MTDLCADCPIQVILSLLVPYFDRQGKLFNQIFDVCLGFFMLV